ncbi:TIGR04104 family putative zinc finger protein [Virgibacillus sp. SK37]|uniref:TIGR04104 family putative zinc finger protein n=1 Tax=Virgibacillus sp. SK37 TaxID=403957 RepID=UPI0004D105EE|nr:TIGR04104 family putative zinc finger protein [Virgibacillus sp. SK37]AIF42831.1 hypothetical protein X953_05960 [Virgibacillus sp. SK37]
MPACQNCGKAWTWVQTVKTLFKLTCPYCGEKQYESAASRTKSSVFMLIPLLILIINVWLQLSFAMVILTALLLVLIILACYPFILELSNEKEPYW